LKKMVLLIVQEITKILNQWKYRRITQNVKKRKRKFIQGYSEDSQAFRRVLERRGFH
jgi:hypothetical protein